MTEQNRNPSQPESRVLTPVIVSASRATDIPAFYGDWLQERIAAGWLDWRNPFSGRLHRVSFAKTRLFVFWTKYPQPFFPVLDWLEERGYHYYFQFTLNDYEQENWEPGLPALQERIRSFVELSERLGREKVVWRWDPLITNARLSPELLLERIQAVGKILHPHTERLVFSFVDIAAYRRVRSRLDKLGEPITEISPEIQDRLAGGISRINQNWNLQLATCAERIDLAQYGIEHNRCIDDRLIIRLFAEDKKLMAALGCTGDNATPPLETEAERHKRLKDKGQRPACGCIRSKDIGQYNSCRFGCIYCYAQR